MSSTINNVKEVVNILSDDDNECSIECLETVDLSVNNSTVKPSGTTVTDTVVLDEEDSIDINVNIKLKMTNMAGSSNRKKSCDSCDSKTLRTDILNLDNMLLREIIELCLQLENSPFMIRFLKNMVLRLYQQANMEYRKSKRFSRILMNTKRCLKNNPQCKFSYMMNMCDNLKLHAKSQKNKGQLVTLATSLNENISNYKNKRTHSNNAQNSPKKQKTVLIDLDSEDKTSTVINLDEYKFDAAVVNKSMSKHQGKENKVEVIDLDCIETSNTDKNANDILLIPNPMERVVDNNLRNNAVGVLTDAELIKMKELEIVKYRNMIEELEKQEVDDDTFESPYIKCEKLKEKIVNLYKEICSMTGSATVKRRQVRLKVIDGHPPGPVTLLQEFLNNNIGENGFITFPDFLDVVKCVKKANIEDNLGWNTAQVQEEARRLFVQCGEALQKKRQHREWRDLMRWVKSEKADADPADHDPALRARLEANRKIGVKNEAELIKRYSMIQSTKPVGKVIDNSDTLRVNKESLISSRDEKGPSFRDLSIISDTVNCSKVSVSTKPGRKVPVHSDTLCVNRKLSMQDSSVIPDAENSSKVSQAPELKRELQDNSVTLDVNSEPVISIEDTEKSLIRDSSVIPDAENSSEVSQAPELKGKLQDNSVTLDVNSEPVISIEDTEKTIIRDSNVIPDTYTSSKVSQAPELKGKLQDNSVTLDVNSEPVISIENTEKFLIRDSSVIPDAENSSKVSQAPELKRKLQDNSVTLDVNSETVISIEDTEKTIIRDSNVIPDADTSSKVSQAPELKRKLQDNSVTLDVNSEPVISIEDTEKNIIRDSSVIPDAENCSKVSQAPELKRKLQDNSVKLDVNSETVISIEDKEKTIIRDSNVIPDADTSSKVSQARELKRKLQDNPVTLDVNSEPVISIEDTEKTIIRDSSVVSDVGNSSKVSEATQRKGKLQDNSHTLGEPIISIEDKEKSIIRDSSVILDAGNTNELSLMMCEIETVPNIKIKEEPVEKLMQEFNQFGDNFTTEILDIEDPFLVIEISSDSSSSDEEELG